MKETVKMLAEGMTGFLPFLESGQTRGNIKLILSGRFSTKEKALLHRNNPAREGFWLTWFMQYRLGKKNAGF